jgi:SNF2 family DNA or RNA helicase
MAVDRRQKKKKKREEKQKAKRQEAERVIRIGKAEDYDWEARHAFRNRDYREALSWALKKLKLFPADTIMRRIALHSAAVLDDEATLLSLMAQVFREGSLTARDDYLKLGQLAATRHDFKLAKEVLVALISDATSDTPRLTGRFSQAKLTQANRMLLYMHQMEKKPRTSKQAGAKPSVPQTGPRPGAAAPSNAASGGAAQAAPGDQRQEAAEERLPTLKIEVEADPEPVLQTIRSHQKSDPASLDMALRAYKLSFRTSYDQLICLPTLRDVTSLWYQEETVRKIMKTFRGRAILADEVGLGKTIEAGLVIKEYMMRGLVRTALVLTPSSLVNQWQEELTGKFGMPFVSTNDPLFKQDPDRFWSEPLILASIQTAKNKRHFDAVTSHSYDIVVADEAHHLKNRATLNWKLLNSIQKTFVLMLTATPVQNSLEELFNLVTLLRPGHLKTQKAFKEQFVTRGNPTDPRNREVLRQLLKEVMVRNTRSITQLHLPPRFALTVRVTPTPDEEAFYASISAFVSEQGGNGSSKISKFVLKKLLEAAGSSHAASLRMLERMSESVGREEAKQVGGIIELGRRIRTSGKAQKVVELLKASKDQKIVFINYVATLEYVQQVLREHGISHVVYHGGMNKDQKQAAIDSFRDGMNVLLATGTGGEGHNLQFCHNMLNYDLPWNPMEIEQRIGRIHRIGQDREVQVYNFCAAGSIEDRILEILDKKINMFELVVGEIDMILGRLQGEDEFSEMVYEIWVKNRDEAERQKAFEALATRLKRARSAYAKSKELDEKLFQEDFGI